MLWGLYAAITLGYMVLFYGLYLLGFASNMDLYNAIAHAFMTHFVLFSVATLFIIEDSTRAGLSLGKFELLYVHPQNPRLNIMWETERATTLYRFVPCMDILIVGAGDVGSNVARDIADSHDVTIIDPDSDQLDALTAQLDVTGIAGDGRSLPILREAGLERADLVIASTDNDATNVMVCNASKRDRDVHTIARVKNVGLFEAWQSLDEGLGVDTMLCIDLLAARSLVQTVLLPGAREVEMFADNMVEVAEFEIGDDTSVTDRSVADFDHYPSLTFAAIGHDDEIAIPDEETVIRSGDYLIVIGSPSSVSKFAREVSDRPTPGPDDEIKVIGGDTFGHQTARLLEDHGLAPQLIEHDPELAARLADRFEETSVIEADATNIDEFGREHLSTADFVVGAADDDTNYLVTQLARELGAARTAAIVDNSELLELFEESGLDVVIHPEDIIANEILQRVYRQRAERVSTIGHDKAEILEIVVDKESILAGSSINDVDKRLPSSFKVGAIIRGETLRTGGGTTIIETGDRVIAFVNAEDATEVAEEI